MERSLILTNLLNSTLRTFSRFFATFTHRYTALLQSRNRRTHSVRTPCGMFHQTKKSLDVNRATFSFVLCIIDFCKNHISAINLIGDIALLVSYSPDVRGDFVCNENLSAFIVANLYFEIDKL